MLGHNFWILDAKFVHAGYMPRVFLKCGRCGLACTGLIETDGDKDAAKRVDETFDTGRENPFSELKLVGAASGQCLGTNPFHATN
jgi:hypothetical protein